VTFTCPTGSKVDYGEAATTYYLTATFGKIKPANAEMSLMIAF